MLQRNQLRTAENCIKSLTVFFACILALTAGMIAQLKFPTTSFAQQGNCTVSVPIMPLSASGLSTPWLLQKPCTQSDPNEEVFIQGVIFDTATKQITTYSPLVIDAGTVPAIPPVHLTLTPSDVVGLFGGANDNRTFLANDHNCDTTTGQVFYCNTKVLFAAINASGIAVPPLGEDINGQVCPSVRSFDIVDQDQSDNVQTTYLLTGDGRTAQNTAVNRAILFGATTIINPSDNRVLSIAVDRALKCTSWGVPNIADQGSVVPTQATDELQAAAYQDQPIALIPAGDPMVGPNDLGILNTYRLDVDQPAVNDLNQANTQAYCTHLIDIGGPFISGHKELFSGFPSPIPGFANLYDFMHQRWLASQQILGCNEPS